MSKNIPGKKIYAVVISYKSSPVLEELYNRIDKDNFDKIYFFDDNSSDGSSEKAKKFKARYLWSSSDREPIIPKSTAQ